LIAGSRTGDRWLIAGFLAAGCTSSPVLPIDNAQPFAHPGTGSSYLVGTLVTLDGSGSWDPDGDSLSFRWSVTRCPAACVDSLADADAAVAQLELRAVGDYEVTLTVSDAGREHSTAIHIRSEPASVALDAGPDRTVEWKIPVELSASIAIEDNRSATVSWELVEQPAESLATATPTGETSASFVPDRAGRYVARVLVETDHASHSDELVVLAHAQTQLLAYRPLRMEYSPALDRIVAISNNPPELHVLDPFAGTETSISLPSAPSFLSVDPTGLRAAVAGRERLDRRARPARRDRYLRRADDSSRGCCQLRLCSRRFRPLLFAQRPR
jgi:hypothetical protein